MTMTLVTIHSKGACNCARQHSKFVRLFKLAILIAETTMYVDTVILPTFNAQLLTQFYTTLAMYNCHIFEISEDDHSPPINDLALC